MKWTIATLLLVAAFAVADPDNAHKQQTVNRLLYKVTEPIRKEFADLYDAAHNYNPHDHAADYSDGGVAMEKLMHEIEGHRVLEQHHYFSLFNPSHRAEALMLLATLHKCKDFEMAAKNAAYFREHLNEGVFVYAFYVSVTHSPFTTGVTLPPLYEITPHMFTNSEVIQQAYSAKMKGEGGNFHMNFTGSKRNPEQRVAYFGEDIGMNSHHVHWHMDFPFWWRLNPIDRKGELFYYAHHQLTARFDAERLSNNLPVVDELYWDKPIVEGFAPHTTYRYGGEFPSRPDNKEFDDVEGVVRVRDLKEMESRIRDAIAHGYFTDEQGKTIDIENEHGIDVVGAAIESSSASPHQRYYGALHNYAHIMLGRQADPKGKFNMPPGVMEHFETATRDPSFFRLHKYMDGIFKEHKDNLPPYTKEEISYDNVDIKKTTIDGNLKTYFENYQFDLSMGLDGDDDVKVTAEVDRLNHEPFTYDIQIEAKAAALVTVRIFFCPKYDYNHIEYTIDEARYHCFEMDKFWQEVPSGESHIRRKSSESSVTIPDRRHYADLIADADQHVADGTDLPLSEAVRACGHPNRMLLPRGKEEGMDFEYFVAITSGDDAVHDDLHTNDHGGNHAYCGIEGMKYPDKKPMGFPLDRHVEDRRVFTESHNIHWETVHVFHDPHHH